LKPESKLWQEVKKNLPEITWTRLESWASLGVPDLLGYTDSHGFFTVELKVISSKKIKFSPHQISFHVTHPHRSFIIAKTLDPRSIKLYSGSAVRDLSDGKQVEPIAENWSAIQEKLINE
tara:strand:+ start:629 stop:988 length:360 start_codon:yes stop_codon:yes gene_type:complete